MPNTGKVRIKRIQIPTVKLCFPDGEYYFLNEYEFMNVRAQIAKYELEGYYILYEDRKININRYGELSENPRGLFDYIPRKYSEIQDIRKTHIFRDLHNKHNK